MTRLVARETALTYTNNHRIVSPDYKETRAETLLGTHSSKPFNPDIARIESWGRGIQKICDACKNLGADEPVYIVYGEDIMVKFNALQRAKVPNSKVPKHRRFWCFG